jgi:hypothetical protein
MVHYDKLGDFLLKASDVMDTDIPGNNQLTVHPIIDLGDYHYKQKKKL